MRGRLGAMAGCLLLAGCIPEVEQPGYRPVPAPPPQHARAPRMEPQRPAPRPVWETHAASADAHVVAAQTYIVRPGETLSRIAEHTGAGVAAIAAANGLAPPYPVRAGQRLTIPGGRYHLVRQGQTGIAIARAYGVPWSRIIAANGLTEPYILRAGQRILIPGEARASTAAERAAAFRLDIDDIITGGEPAVAKNQRTPAPLPPPRTQPRPPMATPRPSTPVPPPPMVAGKFAWPVSGQVVQRFGTIQNGDERSDGIEIAVPRGTPIRATADGIVAYAGNAIRSLGNLVIIKHGDSWVSIYGHAERLTVKRNQQVRKGETIALSGDSGEADRPEVHFELRKGRNPVDPLTQLPRG